MHIMSIRALGAEIAIVKMSDGSVIFFLEVRWMNVGKRSDSLTTPGHISSSCQPADRSGSWASSNPFWLAEADPRCLPGFIALCSR